MEGVTICYITLLYERGSIMSLESVKEHLTRFKLDNDIIYLEGSIATVGQAAEQLGIESAQVGKSLAFMVEDYVIVIVVAGDCRIDNKKFKSSFMCKPKMLSAQQTLEMTSHPVGGVCPFGLPSNVKIYLDVSLQQHDMIYPAAGNANAAIKLSCEQLAEVCTPFEWVDVCKSSDLMGIV